MSSEVMSDEEREKWRKMNVIAFEALRDKAFGDRLRLEAQQLVLDGKSDTRFNALGIILQNIVDEREKQGLKL